MKRTCMKAIMNVKFLMTAVLFMLFVNAYPVYAAGTTTVNLCDIEPTEKNVDWHYENDGVTAVDGTYYKSNVMRTDGSTNYPNSSYAYFDLGKKYSYFTGRIVTGDAPYDWNSHTGDNVSDNFTVYGDGKVLYSCTEISRQKSGIDFKINVSGVKTLKIETSNSGRYNFGFFYIVNGKFIGDRLDISDKNIKMNVREYNYLMYSVTSANGNELKTPVKFKSSNTKVAKVSSKGKVVAVAPGSCKITVKAGTLSKKCTIIVLPSKINGLKVLAKGKTSVQLTWKKQNNIYQYQVWMYDQDLEEYVSVKSVSGKINSARISGLKKNKMYKFKVRAVVKNGKKKYPGDFSKVYKVKTKK